MEVIRDVWVFLGKTWECDLIAARLNGKPKISIQNFLVFLAKISQQENVFESVWNLEPDKNFYAFL